MSRAKAEDLVDVASSLPGGGEGGGVETLGDEEALPRLPTSWSSDLSRIHDIRVDPKFFSVQQIVDWIDSGDIDLLPEFHRKNVWTSTQRSQLIESILLGFPVQAIYLAETQEGRLVIVDGLQRLSSIHDFVRHDFRLESLEYLPSLTGMQFSELPSMLRRRLQMTSLLVYVIDPRVLDSVKFDIFLRLNAGGSPLTPQEMRHSIGGPRARRFLARLADDEAFVSATGRALSHDYRMVGEDLVLRFCAFRMNRENLDRFRSGVATVLTHVMSEIDREATDALDGLADAFVRAMRNANGIFKEHAFRRWPLGDDRLRPINRSLFESWSTALADYEWEALEPRAPVIALATREHMTSDYKYIEAISAGTGLLPRIKYRLQVAQEILAKEAT